MKSAAIKPGDPGAGRLLLALVATCVLSMTMVALFYHVAVGRVAATTIAASSAAQEDLRSSYQLIESLSVTQNALLVLLREKDPDVLEKLVADLAARQTELTHRINAVDGPQLHDRFNDWQSACTHIVATFLRGERAEANSELVNRLMPESEDLLAEVRKVNDANERQAADGALAMQADIQHIRRQAASVVIIAMIAVLVGGMALRRHVTRGTGAFSDALARLTSLHTANEALAKSNAQLAAIHQAVLDCVIVLDSAGVIIEFNPAACAAFHCRREDALSRNISELVQIPLPPDAPAFSAIALAPILGKHIEVTAQRHPESPNPSFAAEMAITAATMEGPPLYIVSLRDLTKRRQAEAEKDELNQRLLAASRQAGMAEVAAGVLHNVGNVLSSLNVAACLMGERLMNSEVANLAKLGELIHAHKQDLGTFLTNDKRGQLVPAFIAKLAEQLKDEQQVMLSEVNTVTKGIEHIKQVIGAQQSFGRQGSSLSPIEPASLLELALTMQSASVSGGSIEIVRRLESIEAVPLDQHRIVQILINLIGNARQAVIAGKNRPRQITLLLASATENGAPMLRFEVIDNGLGITPENLARIFSYGFTTKSDGHGFGLHSSARTAAEIGGTLTAQSDGPGAGATFTLQIPMPQIQPATSRCDTAAH